MAHYITHLESAIDGTSLPANQLQTMHKDRPLWVRYDLNAVKRDVSRDQLSARESTLWRYRELLPFSGDDPVSLGEGLSPLLPCQKLGSILGLNNLWIKDESQLPTGSFKSRGMAMAITMARQFGVQRVVVPTAGNAGGAAAAYAARAGIEAFVFMPSDTPIINQMECVLAGAKTFLVDGLISDCGRIVREGKQRMGWFDLSTLKEPYRLEGKKTMGLELAEQCGWELPEVILYPTGGGTGLIGMWKAFAELAKLGWLNSTKLPRMVAVQSEGCAPIVQAFHAGAKHAEPWPQAQTIASGIRVPSAVGGFMILDAIRQSGGRALAVGDAEIPRWMKRVAATEGIAICPETAACVAAADTLVQEGWITPQEKVVIFNTGAAQKYIETITTTLPRISSNESIDWKMIES